MEHYKTKTEKEIRTAMFDGFLAEKCEKYKLSNLNKKMSKIIGSEIKFIYKPIEQNIIPDVPKDFKYDVNVLKELHRVSQIRQLPKLSHEPDVVGKNKFLSNIFTPEMYKNNDVIVLQSCCGTGKTYSVAKYIADSKDKVISIISRKSLLTAQMNEFNDKGLKLNNYEDKETYDLNEKGIICINSIMKYSRQSDAQFNDFVVYIDEVNSFVETISHSSILTKDIKLVYETLIRIIKNCKKLIVSDHTITDAVFHLFSNKKNGYQDSVEDTDDIVNKMFNNKKSKRIIYVKNNHQKFKDVEAHQMKDETTFKMQIQEAMEKGEGFFAGFDSSKTATLYYNSLKDFTKLDCILVTDETRYPIPSDMNEWEGKCVFYSPKIMTGCDFNVNTKQQVFFHMKGRSVLPTSSFQMICRTRNMEKFTWFANEELQPEQIYEFENEFEDDAKCEHKYNSLSDVRNLSIANKEKRNLYMCSSYLDENDDLQYAPNSFYNIYIYNEFVKSIYEEDKAKHFTQLLVGSNSRRCVVCVCVCIKK